MNNGMMIVGAIVLAASVFGYMYSQDQQGILEQGQDAISGDQRDWGLIEAFSGAGLIVGVVLLVAGVIPENRDPDDRKG